MGEDKIKCNQCEAMILPATAARTEGVCMPCWKNGNPKEEKKSDSIKIEDIFEAVDFGIRFMMAIGFCIAAAVFGYSLGAVVWSGIGVILALAFMPIGFIYGFFAAEINFFIRLAFKAFRLWAGF